ncbi:nuclear transport factor 2 family protein [Tunturibacter psychrotolerans]|uniref:Nuclear transport factor 2 family protein n=1 Tax=Tunturiibacter psychrotolerans TaxID=3069686 RepID=A0AAU7ZSA8_9BACT
MKPANRIASTFLLVTLTTLAASAQTPAQAPPPLIGSIATKSDWPQAKPDDVKSPEAILNAVYTVISGPKEQQRDWDRMRSLFVPDARLIPVTSSPTTGHADVVVLTIDGYIARSQARMAANGFFERSIHNEIEQFGDIVQIWSTYESRHNPADPTPFARGINSFQLLKDGDRYWIVNIFWDTESPTNPIPAKYLPK